MKIKLAVVSGVVVSGCIALFAFSRHSSETAPTAFNYTIDFSQKTAFKSKMTIGGNISHFTDSMRNWPANGLDMVKGLGITSVRTHDIKSMDWDMIFPNFQADVEDPASYQFDKGDAILGKFTEAGMDVFLRLGVSTEASTKQRMPGVNPQDYVKWTSIVDHILKHYTAGWANGGHYNIHYVELWNEPDLKFWGGSQDDFVKLATTSLPVLEKDFPQLKFGGFALSNIAKNKDFAQKLLAGLSDPNGDGNTNDRIRLDFFSWHVYEMQKGVQLFSQFSSLARQLLSQSGYQSTENICTEWNASLPSAYLQTSGAAADVCSTLIWAASNNVNGVYFYPIVDSWGLIKAPLFNLDYRKFQRSNLYNAFALFSSMYEHSDGTITVNGPAASDVLVTTSGTKTNILISNRDLANNGFTLNFKNVDLSKATITGTVLTTDGSDDKQLSQVAANGNSITINPADLNQSDVTLLTIEN